MADRLQVVLGEEEIDENFVHLHLHTSYSFLMDLTIHTKQLKERKS